MIVSFLFGVCAGWWLGIATVFGIVAVIYKRGVRGC